MSNYERESATIILPTTEVAPLKQALREYQNTLRDEVRIAAIALHKAINTRSLKLYKERWQQHQYGSQGRNSSWHDTSRQDLVNTLARSVVWRMLYRVEKEGVAPQQPTLADLENTVAKATNKTTRFSAYDGDGYGEAEIRFQGRTVIWDVPENNHAVDHAREGEMARLFFGYLDRIQWTRGTGGVGLYHSEYQEDGEFDYAASISFAYGPKGEQVQAQRMGVSVTKYRSITHRTRTTASIRW
jgi:hypothetical protein